MKVYIDNEEVICNSNFNITKSLANTHSVILNNVYPKSWGRDYTSNYYMPKDYSKCSIVDDTYNNNKTLDYNLFYLNDDYVSDNELMIKQNTGSKIQYSAVFPNETYQLKVTATTDTYIYQSNGFTLNNEVERLAEIHTGENTITITPTKKYIIFNGINENLNTVTSNYSLEIVTSNNIYDLENNIIEVKNRLLRYSDSKILYSDTYNIYYMSVIPNRTYVFTLKNPSGSRYVCESDNYYVESTTTRLQYITVSGSAFYSVTPTKKYIVWDSTMEISSIKTICPGELLFSGLVKNSGNISLNPRHPHYTSLQILDYVTLLSEGDMLNYVLEKQSILNVLKIIVRDLDGFMLGKVDLNTDEEIGPYNCSEKTPYDVFEYIAEVTGAIWYTQTVDDDLTLINFCSTDNLNNSNTIEYTQEYFCDNKITNITYEYNAKDYRNKQIITSAGTRSSIAQVEYINYNGFDLKTLYPIDSIVSIKKR